MKHFLKKKRCRNGFTLPELLIATFVIVTAFVGLMFTFVKCMVLNEMAANKSLALTLAKTKMEEIKNTPFANIEANYNDVAFATGNLDGQGVTYVDDSNVDLLEVTVSVCWRQRDGRVVGEDQNLNGSLDGGEDTMVANGIIDSPVQLVTRIFDE